MKKIKDTLPNKPSELIRVALADLAKVERDKKYSIAMSEWHSYRLESFSEGVCCVCLAGSVMAKTLKIPHDDTIDPDYVFFSRRLRQKLVALDSFRRGNVSSGLVELDITPEEPFINRRMPYYEESPKVFKYAMRVLADDLEKAGL